MWVPGAGGEGGELAFSGHRVSVWEDEQVPETDGSNGGTIMGTYLMPLKNAHKGKFFEV